MAKIFFEKDTDPALLKSRKVAILGYGAQGHAHAQNLRDSGVELVIGLYDGSKSRKRAEADGFTVLETAKACSQADFIMVLTPDEYQGELFKESIKPNLQAGDALAFCHGFSVTHGEIDVPKDVDLILIAPKGQGHMVRRTYLAGQGVPGLVGVEQDASGNALKLALSYAHALGCARMGIYMSSFREEAICDLFGEQAVLCGGALDLMRAGFETLVEGGYAPEVAYFECIHEMKLIVDLVYEAGFSALYPRISDTAEYGGFKIGPNIITKDTRAAMRKCLDDIESGDFAREWLAEAKAGKPRLLEMRAAHSGEEVDQVGDEVRALFTKLDKDNK